MSSFLRFSRANFIQVATPPEASSQGRRFERRYSASELPQRNGHPDRGLQWPIEVTHRKEDHTSSQELHSGTRAHQCPLARSWPASSSCRRSTAYLHMVRLWFARSRFPREPDRAARITRQRGPLQVGRSLSCDLRWSASSGRVLAFLCLSGSLRL
jgi:hypothetical protein